MAGAVDFQGAADALVAWVERTTGLVVEQYNDPRPFVDPEKMAAAYLSILGIERLGVDETRVGPGTGLLAEQVGQRVMTVQLRVESLIQRLNESAHFYLENARTGLRLAPVKQILQDAGLSIVDTLPSVNLDLDMDDRMRSVSAFDVRFGLASHLFDVAVDSIETVKLKSQTLDGPDGQPAFPQIDIEVSA